MTHGFKAFEQQLALGLATLQVNMTHSVTEQIGAQLQGFEAMIKRQRRDDGADPSL